MTKVFLDTNVILDSLIARIPYDKEANTILVESETFGFELCVTGITIADLNYLARKKLGKPQVREQLRILETLLSLIPIDNSTVRSALESDFTDVEDSLQNLAAQSGAKIIITRNPKDFKTSSLEVLEPDAFIKKYHTES